MITDLLFSEKLPFQLSRNFIIGGIIVSSVSYIATFLSPVVAAIWWSYPFTLLPTLYFMRKNRISTKNVSFFLKSTSIALIILIGTVLLLNHYVTKKLPLLKVVVFTTLWWMLFSTLLFVGYKFMNR
jgi:hypothetical protein